MAEISAARVKELRERTGSGMMECKRALQETGGDIEAAVELMRKTGLAKADKKSGRVAAEGLIALHQSADGRHAVLLEVNCETDFVAKGEAFQGFVARLAHWILAHSPHDLDALLAGTLDDDGKTVDEARRELVARIGENIHIRRFSRIATQTGRLGGYLHSNRRIGVVVELIGGNPDLARDIAMHVAASNPLCIRPEQVPAGLIAKEREIYTAKAQQSGKPADIIARMVEGNVRKFLAEVTLLGQPFVKDDKQTVAQLLADAQAEVLRFVRFELGEGLEKKSADFAAEVMAQVRGD